MDNPVNLYWYWPFLRREELELVDGVVRPGDRLLVHTNSRAEDPVGPAPRGCEIDDSLPQVPPGRERGAVWLASRADAYARRVAARRGAIRRGHFDVAHIIYLNYFTDGADLASLGRRVPLVSTVHDVVPHRSRLASPVERRLLAAQYRHAGTLIVHHESVFRRLLAEFPVDPARVHVVPLPIPVVDTRPPRPAIPPTVLLFGTLRRNKGISVLLDAVRRLPATLDVRVVIAGRGLGDVEREVAEAAARDPRIVAELGYATASRKHVLYAAADLVVLPYTSFASQSAVLRDAYSHQVPLVVSDVGALGETVRTEAAGWVVPPGDADALAATLATAVADEPARRAAADAIGTIARSRTPAAVGVQLRAVYELASRARG